MSPQAKATLVSDKCRSNRGKSLEHICRRNTDYDMKRMTALETMWFSGRKSSVSLQNDTTG